jgi:hypothetical protein
VAAALPYSASVSWVLRELALYLELQGVPFKPQALELGAAWLARAPRPLAQLYRGIAHRVAELVDTGHLP